MHDWIIVVSYAKYQNYSDQIDIYQNNQFFCFSCKICKNPDRLLVSSAVDMTKSQQIDCLKTGMSTNSNMDYV